MTTTRAMTVTQYYNEMSDITHRIGEENLRREFAENKVTHNPINDLMKTIELGKTFEKTNICTSCTLLPNMIKLAGHSKAFYQAFSVVGPHTKDLALQLLQLIDKAWPDKGIGCEADKQGSALFRWGFEYNRSNNNATTRRQAEKLISKLKAYDGTSYVPTQEKGRLSPSK